MGVWGGEMNSDAIMLAAAGGALIAWGVVLLSQATAKPYIDPISGKPLPLGIIPTEVVKERRRNAFFVIGAGVVLLFSSL